MISTDRDFRVQNSYLQQPKTQKTKNKLKPYIQIYRSCLYSFTSAESHEALAQSAEKRPCIIRAILLVGTHIYIYYIIIIRCHAYYDMIDDSLLEIRICVAVCTEIKRNPSASASWYSNFKAKTSHFPSQQRSKALIITLQTIKQEENLDTKEMGM